MCYLYLKLRVFLKRKVQQKSVLKGVVCFIYSIDTTITWHNKTQPQKSHLRLAWDLGVCSSKGFRFDSL